MARTHWGVVLVFPLLIAAGGPNPLTLEGALAEAGAANARLPVVAMDVTATEEQLRSARGQQFPRLGVQSDLIVAPSNLAYNVGSPASGENRLQLVASAPLYAGGALHAGVLVAQSGVRASRAAYRIAQKDVDFEVRARFSDILKSEEDLRFREEGLARLRVYLTAIAQRQVSGEGLQADQLRTRSRLATEEADFAEIARQLRSKQLDLNDLLGRDPSEPLTLVPLPLAAPPGQAEARAWERAPELVMAGAQISAAEQAERLARAGRLPRVDLVADVGILGPGITEPTFAGTSFDARLRKDLGASVSIFASWAAFDFGIYASQMALARARAEQARRQLAVISRSVRLNYEKAREDLALLYAQVEQRRIAIPIAKDAYLNAESRYRGGTGTSLEVLDAFTALNIAYQAHSNAVLAYRVAEASALRWGTP